MTINKTLVAGLLVLAGIVGANTAWSACLATGIQLQVLGSGGPGQSGGRASAAYLLWIDGVSRIMIDAGSGTKDQFHQTGADLGAVDLIALSHLHPDHAAELPAILWPGGGVFQLAGPSAAGVFPSVEGFIERLFGAGGAFEVLADRIELDVITVDVGESAATEVWRDGNLVVTGRGVPHADVPTIGYRIDSGAVSIAFTSDQNGSDPGFIDFIRGVDFLVIHLAAAEDATGVIAALHARPSVWGQMAAAAGAGHVVVSHISASSVQELTQSLEILQDNYAGPVSVAEDLMCLDLG